MRERDYPVVETAKANVLSVQHQMLNSLFHCKELNQSQCGSLWAVPHQHGMLMSREGVLMCPGAVGYFYWKVQSGFTGKDRYYVKICHEKKVAELLKLESPGKMLTAKTLQ